MNLDHNFSPYESIARIFSLFLQSPRSSSGELRNFYSFVPPLQKGQLQEFARSPLPVKDALAQIRFTVPIDLTTIVDMTKSQNPGRPTDRFAFLVYFQVITACYVSPDALHSISLGHFMFALSLCTDPSHRNAVDFCFHALLKTSLSLSHFEWTEEASLSVLRHIETNLTLSNANYRLLIKFAEKLFKSLGYWQIPVKLGTTALLFHSRSIWGNFLFP
jgi:hypothetical protein